MEEVRARGMPKSPADLTRSQGEGGEERKKGIQ